MNLDTIKQLLELGWPGIITTFFCVLAWRYYTDTRDEIAYLRQRVGELEVRLCKLEPTPEKPA